VDPWIGTQQRRFALRNHDPILGTQNQKCRKALPLLCKRTEVRGRWYSFNELTYNFDFAIARYNTDGNAGRHVSHGWHCVTDVTTGKDDQSLCCRYPGRMGRSWFAGTLIPPEATVTIFRCGPVQHQSAPLDGTFGTGGERVDHQPGHDFPYLEAIHFPSRSNRTEALWLQDGALPLSGTRWPSFTVIRYTTAGVLDSSFGHGRDYKEQISDVIRMTKPYSVAIQSDQKIVVAGLHRRFD